MHRVQTQQSVSPITVHPRRGCALIYPRFVQTIATTTHRSVFTKTRATQSSNHAAAAVSCARRLAIVILSLENMGKIAQ